MNSAYENCSKLTTAIVGPAAINISYAYSNCPLIKGNAYVFSKNLYTGANAKRKSVRGCFFGRDNSNMLNIYVPKGCNTAYSFRERYANGSITSTNITWTNSTTNNCFYNTQYNIYVYPVANVYESKLANGD